MWGALWALAIDKLGKFTKKGSSLLVMAIVGGAVFPLVFGVLLDSVKAGETLSAADFQNAYWIFVPCYLYILFYALAGHKIGIKSK
jgi:fucose permease